MDNRTIVRGLRGISRRSEVLERICVGFPLVDPLGVWVELPYLVKAYVERKRWNQEGGSVSKEITGSVLTTSMTSRLASVVFKMADKVVVEEGVKNMEFARKIPI